MRLWLLTAVALAEPFKDPHAPLRADPVPEGACNECHAGDPTEADPALQLPAEKICRSCHQREEHVGVASHLGVTLPDAVAARVALAALPLTDAGAIGCVTCHDPHPEADHVRRSSPPAWWTQRFGASAPGSDLARLPGSALCVVCHPATSIATGIQ